MDITSEASQSLPPQEDKGKETEATSSEYTNQSFKTISNCLMPKEQRLSGSTNWINWVSTLRLYFRIINIEKYFIKDEEYENAPEATRNLALLIIRQNLLAEPLSLVFDSTDPLEVLNTLSASYEGTGPVIR